MANTGHLSTSFRAFAALLLILATACKPSGDTVDLPFIGTNMWYASELSLSDPVRFSSELDSLCARGLTNVRILATGEDWKGLDAALAGFSRHGMKAVLFLNNAWEWSEDGYRSWLEKAGAGRQPHPAEDGYVAYMTAMSGFASNAEAVSLYQEHVRRVVTRYKDSDAVYSWQVCNEPRPFSRDSAAVEAFVAYVQGTAALIKSLDPVHKVSTGNEGAMGCNDGDYALCEQLNNCPDIDYMTVHIWPYNWSWVSEGDIAGGVDAAIERTADYIDRHLDIARRLGKKVVIEEFGYPRDGFSFSREATVEGRNRYYGYIFSRVLESARCGGELLGCNFWAWSGLARQTPGHDFWQEGDDLCGDPSQEGQGLNGVYLTDTGTLSVVSRYQDSLSHVVRFQTDPEDGWMHYGSGPFRLRVKVSGSVPSAGFNLHVFRDLDLMDPDAEPLLSKRLHVRTRPGRWTEVTLPLGRLDPGFYRVDLGGVRQFNIGVNPEQIQSPSDRPEDFDAFWASTLSELAAVPLEPRYTEIPAHSSAARTCYHVEIPSWGGATMGGILYVPVAEGRYPVHIEFMGYGADPYYRDPSAEPERIDYLVSVRDQGIFKAGNGEWIDRGLSSREEFYYRGAFCDVVRAVEFAASLPKADTTHIFGCGDSQGGAFTWISAALTDKMRAIAPSVPFLGDYPDYARIVWWPMHEVFQHADAEGIDRDSLMDMLRYFDIKNFTGRITCPVLMAFGLQDPTCPPHTNFAGYNNVTSDKRYMCVPACGHAMWAEPSWNEARAAFFSQY